MCFSSSSDSLRSKLPIDTSELHEHRLESEQACWGLRLRGTDALKKWIRKQSTRQGKPRPLDGDRDPRVCSPTDARRATAPNAACSHLRLAFLRSQCKPHPDFCSKVTHVIGCAAL